MIPSITCADLIVRSDTLGGVLLLVFAKDFAGLRAGGLGFDCETAVTGAGEGVEAMGARQSPRNTIK
jgi:hypothetical protein